MSEKTASNASVNVLAYFARGSSIPIFRVGILAMPAFHGHDDDFLYEVQRSTETPSSGTSAKVFLKRTVNRIRAARVPSVPAPCYTSVWNDFYQLIRQWCWPLG